MNWVVRRIFSDLYNIEIKDEKAYWKLMRR